MKPCTARAVDSLTMTRFLSVSILLKLHAQPGLMVDYHTVFLNDMQRD